MPYITNHATLNARILAAADKARPDALLDIADRLSINYGVNSFDSVMRCELEDAELLDVADILKVNYTDIIIAPVSR